METVELKFREWYKYCSNSNLVLSTVSNLRFILMDSLHLVLNQQKKPQLENVSVLDLNQISWLLTGCAISKDQYVCLSSAKPVMQRQIEKIS